MGSTPQECCTPLGVPHPTEALGSFLTLSSPHSTAGGDRAGSAAPIRTPQAQRRWWLGSQCPLLLFCGLWDRGAWGPAVEDAPLLPDNICPSLCSPVTVVWEASCWAVYTHPIRRFQTSCSSLSLRQRSITHISIKRFLSFLVSGF